MASARNSGLYITLILILSLGFTLRGIWGHQLGGAVMGTLMGLMLSYIFKLPPIIGISLTFWLAFSWAVASFVGWARYRGIRLFLRGYIAYGLIPSYTIFFHLGFPQTPVNIAAFLILAPLGMGLGFYIAFYTRKYARDIIGRKYTERFRGMHPDKEPPVLVWGGLNSIKDKQPDKTYVSFVYVTKFDTWKFLLEEFSGFLYGVTLTAALIISDAESFIREQTDNWQVASVNSWSGILYFFMWVLIWLVPAAAFISGMIKRKSFHDFKPRNEQKRMGGPKMLILSFSGIVLISIVFGYVIYLMNIHPEFLTMDLSIPENADYVAGIWKNSLLCLMWFYLLVGRLCHELDAPVFKMDFLADVVFGAVITLLLLIF